MRTRLIIMMLLALACGPSWGQSIVSFSVPTSMCVGTQEMVTFGYQDTHNVVIDYEQATLGHSDRIFLPDGVPCGTLGCSYRSPVTFDIFPTGASVTSVNDIKYIRLNIEHSFIADIYINVTCPNGQKADIMHFDGQNTSSCYSNIPTSSRHWLSGNNVSGGTFFGLANDREYSSNKCDSTAAYNAPGIGWNYCWSSNTNSGYVYAHASSNDDGIIYRSGHAHSRTIPSFTSTGSPTTHSVIDSSNVAAGTNFYHPDQSFASLIGCPLNGTWYVEVMDGYSMDNGYIFEWELALDPSLIPNNNCLADSFMVSGYGVTMINDSSFTITAPTQLLADSTVQYSYHIFSTCTDIDTVVSLTFHPEKNTESEVVGCGTVSYGGHVYVSDTDLVSHGVSRYGCDSTHTTHVRVYPNYSSEVEESVVENALPHSFMGHVFYGPVEDTLLAGTTVHGCDSNVVYTLRVMENSMTVETDTICADATPYLWNGRQYSTTTKDTLVMEASNGADSVVVLSLTVFPTDYRDTSFEVVENALPVIYAGRQFYESIDTVLHDVNIYGCDSSTRIRLVVHHNHAYKYETAVCDDRLPYDWMGVRFDAADSVTLALTDRYGADSVVTLVLRVMKTYSVDIDTVTCDNIPFIVADQPMTSSGHHVVTLTTAEGCDSVLNIDLTVLLHSETHIYDTVCASEGYMLDGISYTRSGIYTTTLTNAVGCDSIITLHLGLLAEGMKAEIKAIPMVVTPSNPDVRFYDASTQRYTRQWIIEGDSTDEQHFTYHYPVEADSLPVMLIAYSIEGCADTAQTVIQIDRAALAIPNVFTPDESTNNTWQPAIRDVAELKIWIYTRQGLLVAHLEGLDARWDGTKDGERCPQGAYVFNLEYRTRLQPEKLQRKTGTILLVR